MPLARATPHPMHEKTPPSADPPVTQKDGNIEPPPKAAPMPEEEPLDGNIEPPPKVMPAPPTTK